MQVADLLSEGQRGNAGNGPVDQQPPVTAPSSSPTMQAAIRLGKDRSGAGSRKTITPHRAAKPRLAAAPMWSVRTNQAGDVTTGTKPETTAITNASSRKSTSRLNAFPGLAGDSAMVLP
ncbi:hypothetical protein [Paracoccus sp. N5]|uniref:hypothetical protein n=1 Tax=Paracoccus sp. N5 TaxID=1101189 RepID=UPI0003607D61|nr:hypothetical protein [Paracoccus sp. N5]